MADEWELFKIIEKTFENGIQNPVEVGDLSRLDVFATGIQLAETGKVSEIDCGGKNEKKTRVFEKFIGEEIEKIGEHGNGETKFIEVENWKNGEVSDFQFAGVHFCTCDYFKTMVLEKCEDWICCHLIATKTSTTPNKTKCGSEISNILRKIVVKPIVKK